MAELLDSILTFIERREAEQIQYGLYDALLTGGEVLDAFLSEPEQKVRAALTALWQRGRIIRFEENADHREWLLRSRIAETVRLVGKLRQRISDSERELLKARADRSPRLVHDLKFEVQRRYAPARDLPMADLVAPLRTHHPEAAHILEALFPAAEFQFSGFQQRAFQAIADHILLRPQRGNVQGAVVTASTGAGKTYAFFLPVLAHCLVEKGLHGRAGVKAICIYPRVALSENQLEDFVRLLYQVNQHLPPERAITVGIDSGASPYTVYDFTRSDHHYLQRNRGWRWEEAEARYVCPFARCPICDGELAVQQTEPGRIFCTACGESHPFILYAKEQFREAPPDVLVATTESLNTRMMDSAYQMLFGDADVPPPAVVMLDEIHLQSSTKGMQIGFLLRRLAARIRQAAQTHPHRPNLMLVGLSATIAQPQAFFSDLTGLPPASIDVVAPEESEMIAAGAERYLFVRAEQEEDTAVISTLLQTAMALVHTMPETSPEEQAGGIAKYKTFGFAQSLDIVGRWFYQLSDAEKVNRWNVKAREGLPPELWPIEHTPLYWYRMPGHNRRLFPDFFGKGLGSEPCPCPQRGYPDRECVYFQEGECWWAMVQGLQDPMRLKRKSAQDRLVQIGPEDDLIITTTALEVGYDDASLMGVIQYQSPSNVASFVQRKGRGGRAVGSRPIVAAVLSPYKTGDVFLYQNHHLLVEPEFQKLPLNPANPFLQRIHGFYALIDWLAYRAAQRGMRLKLGKMEAPDYAALRQLTDQAKVLDAFGDYLADAFHLQDDPARLQQLLVDPDSRSWNDDGILTQGLSSLMDALHRAYDKGQGGPVDARADVLHDYLPQNLFSDINLPELDVLYDRKHKTEDVSLGLSVALPGNVTFRSGYGSCWIAPPVGEGQVFILEEAYTLSQDRRHEIPIEATSLPRRIEQLIQAHGRLPRAFSMLRPTEVRLKLFGPRDRSRWWLDRSKAPGAWIYVPPSEDWPQGKNIRRVRHASSAYPVGFTQVTPPSAVGRRFSFVPQGNESRAIFNDLGRALFKRLDFASDVDHGRLIKVQRVIVGSRYSLALDLERDPLDGVVTFARRESPDELTAIGYEMATEGITFTLSELPSEVGSERMPVSEETAARLQRNFVKHAVVTELSAQPAINYFAAERLAEVLLTVANLLTHDQSWPLDTFTSACRSGSDELRGLLSGVINRVYHLSRKKTRATLELFNRDEVRALFAERYVDICAGGPLYRRYLEDTFVHTLKHALKQTAQTLAGVEAMEYVSAYTQLNVDFGELRDRPIWLYELGMGGVGVLRTVQDVLRDQPSRFWRTLKTLLLICDTEQEDHLLLDVLAQPEDILDTLHALVGQIHAATTSAARQEALHGLRQGLRRTCGLFPQRTHIRLLVKLFSDDYAQRGVGLRNWRLYRELNVGWIPALTQRLGRRPTPVEARGFLHYEFTHQDGDRRDGARRTYPELARLLDLYQREYGGSDVRRVFENGVGRRLLLNCVDACPTCLDEGVGCQIDPPGLSALTLSRVLVNEVLDGLRQGRTLTCTGAESPAALADRIAALFQQDLTSPVFVKAPGDLANALARLLSHLTDYGVVDRLERRYPRVTQVVSRDGALTLQLSLETSPEASLEASS